LFHSVDPLLLVAFTVVATSQEYAIYFALPQSVFIFFASMLKLVRFWFLQCCSLNCNLWYHHFYSFLTCYCAKIVLYYLNFCLCFN